jgi:hypothetical protein
MVSTSCSTEGIAKMKRRTLDLAFSVGGLLFGGLILVLGLVLQNQANFAENYVKDQLGQQQIEFTAVDYLHGEQDDAPCLVEFAGTQLDSGKKSECYANEYIAYHLATGATEAGYEGTTYATIGAVQRGLGAEIQAAKDAGKDTTELDASLTSVNALRETMFKGETLRGLLLTTYGFSIFGERAALAATICFIAAALLVILSLAGLIHFKMTPADKVVSLGH